MDANSNIGRVVFSKAGRDEKKAYVIIGEIDHQYVYVCDGDLRSLERPKKKKIKHLVFTNNFTEDIRELILKNQKVENSLIRKYLQSYDNNKEV